MRTGLGARIGGRLLVFAAVLVVIGCLAFVAGIKADADQLREAQNRVSALYQGYGPLPGAGQTATDADAALAKAKAALTGPRWVICEVLTFCHGLTN